MNTILLLFSGLVAGIIIMYMRDFILKRVKKEIPKLISEEDKKKLNELFNKKLIPVKTMKKNGLLKEKAESFNPKKLSTGMLKINNRVLWAKDLASIFNLRKLIIISVIIGLIYGIGWYQGKLGKPVKFDMRGKEATIQLNEHYLKIEKNGTAKVMDENGNLLKIIKVKDIPELRRALRPYGFILEPVAVVGGGISNEDNSFEGGIGIRYLKYFRWLGDICITNKGFYPLGVSYKITENSAIGASVGTGYKKHERGLFERFLIKFSIKF